MLWSKIIGAGGAGGGGSISLVGHSTSSAVGQTPLSVDLTSLTGGLSSAPEPGDLVLIFISGTGFKINNWNIGGITTTGYVTPVDRFARAAAVGYRSIVTVGYKIMGITPDSVVNCSTASTGTASQIAHVRVYRGVDAITPIDTTPSTTSGENTVVDPPPITPISSVYLTVSGGSLSGEGFRSGSYSSNDLDNVISTAAGNAGSTFITLSAWGDSLSTVDPAAFVGSGISTYSNTAYTAATIVLRPA